MALSRSAYTLFYQCARKQLYQVKPELSFQEYPTICSKIWRDMPDAEKTLWKTDSLNDRRRYEEEMLALASSEVANTATSIVMEEQLNKMKLQLKPEELESILAAHVTRSPGGRAKRATTELSSELDSQVEAPPKKKTRGKYKKRQQPADAAVAGSSKKSSVCHPPHSEPARTVHLRDESGGKGDGWMDISFPSHDSNKSGEADIKAEAVASLSAYSLDSLDQDHCGAVLVPMAGLDKSNLSTERRAEATRDFVAAGMRATKLDDDDELAATSDKPFQSRSQSRSLSPQQRVRQEQLGLFGPGLEGASSSSKEDDLMPFSSFEDFRQL